MSRRTKMSNSKRIFSMFLLVTLSSIGLSAKAQRQSSRVSTRQVSNILRQLEQSSDRFRNSLSTSLDQLRSDETSNQNHIKSVERDFENATNQLRDRFN